MPQIANTKTMPEWEDGYLLAGNLKTLNGEAKLYLSGDWSEATCPSGLVIVFSKRDIGATDLYFACIVGSYSAATKLTPITFKLYNALGAAQTDNNIYVDYMIWVVNSNQKYKALVYEETIKLK